MFWSRENKTEFDVGSLTRYELLGNSLLAWTSEVRFDKQAPQRACDKESMKLLNNYSNENIKHRKQKSQVL